MSNKPFNIRLACHAMATRFEFILNGDDPISLRAAGEAALDEISRIENQLSLYRPGSEIAQLNARAAREPVQVSPELLLLLRRAWRLSIETDGAFDITMGPLVRCWGFMNGTGRMPEVWEVRAALNHVGMSNLSLDEKASTVRFTREGTMLDLGAIGKGYAVERAGSILREANVTSALIHGGTSTVCAIGKPPEASAWKIRLDIGAEVRLRSKRFESILDLPESVVIPLVDQSLSVSAPSGRCLQQEGRIFGHVIDPRTGMPIESAWLAAVVLPFALESDALSTALLVGGDPLQQTFALVRPEMKTLLLAVGDESIRLQSHSQFTGSKLGRHSAGSIHVGLAGGEARE